MKTNCIAFATAILLVGGWAPALAKAVVTERLSAAMSAAESSNQPVRALVMLADQVDVEALDAALTATRATASDRAFKVITELQTKARVTQAPLIEWLAQKPASQVLQFKSYWIANLILVEASPSILTELSSSSGVAYLDLDEQLAWDQPAIEGDAPSSPNGAEPGLKVVNAHKLWALGITGQGRIVMNIDTGVDGNHPAFASRWRGTHVPASQAWIDPPGGSTFPNDCDSHGTHTMGTMTGLQTSTNDTVGVAFGAEWIAAKTICQTPHTSYSLTAFQWAMDPDGNPGTITDMPDAIGNSWFDPNVSDCGPPYLATMQAIEAAGIAVIFSAGNAGPGAQTITYPKNINTNLVNVFSTGNINGNVAGYPITSSSSRGPSICGGTGSLLIKPEVVAPGTSVRSSIVGGGYAFFTGTSMACPHVVGAIALLKQAFPNKTGYELKLALYETAADLGPVGEDNDYGKGLIDVYAAYLSLGTPTIPDDLVLQNQTLSGTQTFEANNSITAGPSLTITPTGNITFHVINDPSTGIVLRDGFTCQEGATFRAYVGAGTAPGLASGDPSADEGPSGGPAEAPRDLEGIRPSRAAAEATRAEFDLTVNSPSFAAADLELAVELPAGAFVSLEIYDVQGRRVWEALNGYLPAGRHIVRPPVGTGAALGPGVWFARLKTSDRLGQPGFSTVRRLVLLGQ